MGKYDRKDHFYNKAQAEGYRSRAAYKLIELDKKYKLIKRGYAVSDLGAWPGGWLEVAAKRVGPGGVVVGVDLKEIDDISDSRIVTVEGDVRDDETIGALKSKAGRLYDVVLSDMSPKLTGIKSVDRVGAVGCAELALWAAQQILRDGGNLVIKLFKSNEAEEFVRSSRPLFQKAERCELKSTRKTSTEFYGVFLGFKREAQEKE